MSHSVLPFRTLVAAVDVQESKSQTYTCAGIDPPAQPRRGEVISLDATQPKLPHGRVQGFEVVAEEGR